MKSKAQVDKIVKFKMSNGQIESLLEESRVVGEVQLTEIEAELRSAYLKSLKEIQAQISDIYTKYGDDVNYGEVMKFNRLANIEKQIAGQIKILTGEVLNLTSGSIMSGFELGFYSIGYALETVTDTNLGFGLLNPKTIKAAIENKYDRITWEQRLLDHANENIQAIKQELSQGLIQGKGYSKIAKAVQERTEIGAGKAMRIIRTEAHRAQSEGRRDANLEATEAGKRLGLEMERVWRCTYDNLTRPEHAAADGQVADKNGQFTVGGEKLDAPGVGGSAWNVIHCRCTEVARITGATRQRVDNLTKERTDVQTMDEWMKAKGIKLKYRAHK